MKLLLLNSAVKLFSRLFSSLHSPSPLPSSRSFHTTSPLHHERNPTTTDDGYIFVIYVCTLHHLLLSLYLSFEAFCFSFLPLSMLPVFSLLHLSKLHVYVLAPLLLHSRIGTHMLGWHSFLIVSSLMPILWSTTPF